MFSPVVPHITEELFSLYFAEREGLESIHISDWPVAPDEWRDDAAEKAGELALTVIEGMRKLKSESKVSVATPLGTLRVATSQDVWDQLSPLSPDLAAVSNADGVEYVLWDGEGDPGDGFIESDNAAVRVAADIKETE